MKANACKRKIFDTVDLLTEDTSAQTTEVKADDGYECFLVITEPMRQSLQDLLRYLLL